LLSSFRRNVRAFGRSFVDPKALSAQSPGHEMDSDVRVDVQGQSSPASKTTGMPQRLEAPPGNSDGQGSGSGAAYLLSLMGCLRKTLGPEHPQNVEAPPPPVKSRSGGTEPRTIAPPLHPGFAGCAGLREKHKVVLRAPAPLPPPPPSPGTTPPERSCAPLFRGRRPEPRHKNFSNGPAYASVDPLDRMRPVS